MFSVDSLYLYVLHGERSRGVIMGKKKKINRASMPNISRKSSLGSSDSNTSGPESPKALVTKKPAPPVPPRGDYVPPNIDRNIFVPAGADRYSVRNSQDLTQTFSGAEAINLSAAIQDAPAETKNNPTRLQALIASAMKKVDGPRSRALLEKFSNALKSVKESETAAKANKRLQYASQKGSAMMASMKDIKAPTREDLQKVKARAIEAASYAKEQAKLKLGLNKKTTGASAAGSITTSVAAPSSRKMVIHPPVEKGKSAKNINNIDDLYIQETPKTPKYKFFPEQKQPLDRNSADLRASQFQSGIVVSGATEQQQKRKLTAPPPGLGYSSEEDSDDGKGAGVKKGKGKRNSKER